MSQTRTNTSSSNRRSRGGGGGVGGRARGGNPNQNNYRSQTADSTFINRGNRGQTRGRPSRPYRAKSTNRGRESRNADNSSSWGSVLGNFVLQNSGQLLDFAAKGYDYLSEKNKEKDSTSTNAPDNSQYRTPPPDYQEAHYPENGQYRTPPPNYQESQYPQASNQYQHQPNAYHSSNDYNPHAPGHYNSRKNYPTFSDFANANQPPRARFNNRGSRYVSDRSQYPQHQNHHRSYDKERVPSANFHNYQTNSGVFNDGNESISPPHTNARHQPHSDFAGNNHSKELSQQSSTVHNNSKDSPHQTNVRKSVINNSKPTKSNTQSPTVHNNSQDLPHQTNVSKSGTNNSKPTKSNTVSQNINPNPSKSKSGKADSSTKSNSLRAYVFEDIPSVTNTLNTNRDKLAKSRSVADIEKRRKILLAYGFKLGSTEIKKRNKDTVIPTENSESSPISQSDNGNSDPQNELVESTDQDTSEPNIPPNQESNKFGAEQSPGRSFIALVDKIEKPIIDPQKSDQKASLCEYNKPNEPVILDLSKQMNDYKTVLQSYNPPTIPGEKRRKESRKFNPITAHQGNPGSTISHQDDLTDGIFSGVQNFNIHRTVADHNEKVPSQSETRRKFQSEHDAKAAQNLQKVKEKEAKKREEYLAKYSHVDQGYRMTDGPLHRNGFDQAQARMSEEEVRQMQQERFRRDALKFQQRQQEENERQRLKEEKKRQEWLDSQRMDAGYRLGGGEGRRHSREEMGYIEEYDNEYNEDLYGENLDEELESEGAFNPYHQRQENEYQRQGADLGHQRSASQSQRDIGFEQWQGDGSRGNRSAVGRSPSPVRDSALLRSVSPDLKQPGETEEQFLQRLKEEQQVIEALIQSQLKRNEEDEILRRVIEQSKNETRITQDVTQPARPGSSNVTSSESNTSASSTPTMRPSASDLQAMRPSASASDLQTMRPSAPPQQSGTKITFDRNPTAPPTFNEMRLNFIPNSSNKTSETRGPGAARKPIQAENRGSVMRSNSQPDAVASAGAQVPAARVLRTDSQGSSNVTSSESNTSASSQPTMRPSAPPQLSGSKITFDRNPTAPPTFNEMRQNFIPNTSNKTSETRGPGAARKPIQAENCGSMMRSNSQPDAVASVGAQVPAARVLRTDSKGSSNVTSSESNTSASSQPTMRPSAPPQLSGSKITFDRNPTAPPTFNEMRQNFIPNSSNKTSETRGPGAARKPIQAENRGSMMRSNSQPDAVASAGAQVPAARVLRTDSQGATLVLRPTEEDLNKALANKLTVIDEIDKMGHSAAYKPNAHPDPEFSNNRFDKNNQRAVDIGKATGAIPKQRTPTSPSAPVVSKSQNEIDHQAEMRAARLRMQQKYEESLKAKQENQDST